MPDDSPPPILSIIIPDLLAPTPILPLRHVETEGCTPNLVALQRSEVVGLVAHLATSNNDER